MPLESNDDTFKEDEDTIGRSSTFVSSSNSTKGKGSWLTFPSILVWRWRYDYEWRRSCWIGWAANSRYGMEQRPNHAVLKDAQTLLSEEECASRMGRRKSMQQ